MSGSLTNESNIAPTWLEAFSPLETPGVDTGHTLLIPGSSALSANKVAEFPARRAEKARRNGPEAARREWQLQQRSTWTVLQRLQALDEALGCLPEEHAIEVRRDALVAHLRAEEARVQSVFDENMCLLARAQRPVERAVVDYHNFFESLGPVPEDLRVFALNAHGVPPSAEPGTDLEEPQAAVCELELDQDGRHPLLDGTFDGLTLRPRADQRETTDAVSHVVLFDGVEGGRWLKWWMREAERRGFFVFAGLHERIVGPGVDWTRALADEIRDDFTGIESLYRHANLSANPPIQRHNRLHEQAEDGSPLVPFTVSTAPFLAGHHLNASTPDIPVSTRQHQVQALALGCEGLRNARTSEDAVPVSFLVVSAGGSGRKVFHFCSATTLCRDRYALTDMVALQYLERLVRHHFINRDATFATEAAAKREGQALNRSLRRLCSGPRSMFQSVRVEGSVVRTEDGSSRRWEWHSIIYRRNGSAGDYVIKLIDQETIDMASNNGQGPSDSGN
ncbi:MAG: hypothetical protein KDK91_10500 [Gammaproteobacteria bacterium]|nr:hypothetical protein [Gammaproteobacteria bacterium]